MDTRFCLEMLNSPVNMAGVEAAFPNNGVVYINWCENVPPYATFVYVNLNDVRVKYAKLEFPDRRHGRCAGVAPSLVRSNAPPEIP